MDRADESGPTCHRLIDGQAWPGVVAMRNPYVPCSTSTSTSKFLYLNDICDTQYDTWRENAGECRLWHENRKMRLLCHSQNNLADV